MPIEQPAGPDGKGPAVLDSVTAVVTTYQQILGGPEAATQTAALSKFLEEAKLHKENASHPPPGTLTLDTIPNKEHRRAVHQLFKSLDWAPPLATEAFAVVSESTPNTTKELHGIQLRVNTAAGRRGEEKAGAPTATGQKRKWQDRNSQQQQWAGGKARYVRFALYKENFDTHHALTTLAKVLHVSQKVFSVAGTKDKRGVTVQQVTAYSVPPSKLVRINAAIRDIRVGNFEYVSEELRLGDLQGNRFEIVLRALSTSSVDAVEAAAAAVKRCGFINYFGLQRFGSSATSPTHSVGRCLLRGEWMEAVQHIMAPSYNTKVEVSEAVKAFFGGGSAEKALSMLARQQVAERTILMVLGKDRTALVNALQAIPRNLRTMYIHAYQSYLWNEAASERVLKHGADKVIAGDLVIPRSTLQAARKAMAMPQHHQQDDSTVQKEENEEEEPVVENEADVAVNVEPHVVTAEEAAAGKYSFDDVVLPLIGHRVKYPENDIADVYRSIAERDGVSLDQSTHKVKEFSVMTMAGAYRHVLFKPADMEYSVLKYNGKDEELLATDVDVMRGKAAPKLPEDGKFLALKLSFTLPSSTYATMMIRELTKMPTTVDFARSLVHP